MQDIIVRIRLLLYNGLSSVYQNLHVRYIVLKDVVLKYHLGNDEEKKNVCEKCVELGVKREQLDWLD